MREIGRGAFDEMRWPVRSQVWSAKAVETEEEAPGEQTGWLERFHAGDRTALDEVYRGYLEAVHRSAAGVLGGADLETVVHEVFFRLMSNAELRKAFHGGDFGSWLVVIARHHAIDYARRRGREQPAGLEVAGVADSPHDGFASRAEAALLIQKFCREVLPPKWHPVFEARFLNHLSQTEAATALHMRRTTLVYQELRIRHLLSVFLLEETS
jgi:RNA polymerase sigma-70 factor, ECF subfamily